MGGKANHQQAAGTLSASTGFPGNSRQAAVADIGTRGCKAPL